MTLIYDWAPEAARYRDPETGRFVSRATIRQGVDDLVVASQRRITAVSEELRSRVIDIAEWQEVMRNEIKLTQLIAEVLLQGGWSQMVVANYEAVTQRVRDQYEFLDAFTQKLTSGAMRTDGSFMNYARMYAAAARTGFEVGMQEQLGSLGYTEERNVLHPAEHCSECIEITDRGWVLIGTNKPIGTRKCLGNDMCTSLYR